MDCKSRLRPGRSLLPLRLRGLVPLRPALGAEAGLHKGGARLPVPVLSLQILDHGSRIRDLRLWELESCISYGATWETTYGAAMELLMEIPIELLGLLVELLRS